MESRRLAAGDCSGAAMGQRAAGRLVGMTAAGLAAAAALAACGGGAESAVQSTTAASQAAQSAAPANSPAADSQASGAPAAASPAVETAGEVPDPCALLSQDELAAILGTAPGEGVLTSIYPELRKVCTFPGGTILAIEVGKDYDASVAAVATSGLTGTTTDMNGVGEKASFVKYDIGVSQVFALGGAYFVDVTGMLTKKQASELASAMLAAV